MFAFLPSRLPLGAIARLTAALVLAVMVPNLIAAAALPAPGTDGFLIWM